MEIDAVKGRNGRGVATWGLGTLVWTDRGVWLHWELLAYVRRGQQTWTLATPVSEAVVRTKEELLRWEQD